MIAANAAIFPTLIANLLRLKTNSPGIKGKETRTFNLIRGKIPADQ
jgi:hypothetical protein